MLMGGNLGANFGMTPYQPGGTSGSLPGFQQGGDQGNGWIGPARPSSGSPRGSYLGQERNAVFYDMMGGARQRIWNNQLETQQMAGLMGGGTGGLPNLGATLNFNAGMGSIPQPGQQTYAPGMDSFGLIQSLLMGGSTRATFNLQSTPPGF